MFKRYAPLICLCLCVQAWAQIEQLPTFSTLEMTSICQRSSFTRHHVHSDVFPTASPGAPVFIRVQLSNGLRLCETLVWSHPSNAGQPNFSPVYMPIKFHINEAGAEIIAPPETYSVVRWKEGETSFWMQISTPTSQWFTVNGNPAVPDANNVPQLTFGQDGHSAWGENNALFPTGANMRTTSRMINPLVEADSVSMLICLDSSNTDLVPFPSPLSNYDLVSAAFTGIPASGVNSPAEAFDSTDIAAGTDLGVFTGSFDAGSGYLQSLTITPLILPTNPVIADPGIGETMIQTNFQFGINTSFWGIAAGSVFQISIPFNSKAAVPVAMSGGSPIDYSTIDPSIMPGEYVVVDNTTFSSTPLLTKPPRAPSNALFQSSSGIWYSRIVELETDEDNPVVFSGSRVLDFELHAALFSPMAPDPTFNFQYFPLAYSSVFLPPPFPGPNLEVFCPPVAIASPVFGPFALASPSGTPVPALGEWMLFALIILLIGVAIRMNRKQPCQGSVS